MTGAEKNLLPAADGLLDDEHLGAPALLDHDADLLRLRHLGERARDDRRVGFVQREGRGTSPWAEGGTGLGG